MNDSDRASGQIRAPRPRPRAVRRAILLAAVVLLGPVLAAALSGPALAAGEAADVDRSAIQDDSNPRADYWREVREGEAGYTTAAGPERGVLIQSAGQVWREIRNGPVITWGAWGLALILLAIGLFHIIFGTAKLASRSGRTIVRWTGFERFLHWSVALLFIVLAITGFSLLFGRSVLIPLMGLDAFGAYAAFSKALHDYATPFFIVGLVLMLVLWLSQNFPKSYDLEWLREGGGYFRKTHPPAGFVNAGEKIWFWLLLVFGIAVIISGLVLLTPNYEWTRYANQVSNIVHGISALVLTGFVFGHIYLGTLGNEGSFEGMWTGKVDENWAKQHHSVWYREVMEHGEAASRSRDDTVGGSSPVGST
jgi:formate dehydrogenase subunit gamma